MTPEREAIIKKAITDYKWFGSYSSLTIYQDGKVPVDGKYTQGAFWLGVRTGGPVETDHDRVVRVTKEEAKELMTRAGFLNCGFVKQHFVNWNLPDYPLPEIKKPSYDDITPGFWYLKYGGGYTIVEVMIGALGIWKDQKIVFAIDEEGCREIEVYSVDQFIQKVPKPD